MEPLQKRSDGYFETPSGSFAVVPKAVTGTRDGRSWFEYKPSVLASAVRIEWETGAALIIIDQDVARTVLRHGWALNLNDELLDRYTHEYGEQQKAGAKVKDDPAPLPPPADPVAPPPPTGDSGTLADALRFVPPVEPAPKTKAK